MSSLFGYIFGTKSSNTNTSSSYDSTVATSNKDKVDLIHTLLDDEDFILVSDVKDQIVKVNVSSITPQQNDELDFERIEMSVANLVDFMPTLSSSNRNSIRQQILEDEGMKERFRLFLQEQHQSSIRRMSDAESSASNSELSSPSPSPSSSPIIHNSNNIVENSMEQFSTIADSNVNDNDNGNQQRRGSVSRVSSNRTVYSIPSQALKRIEKTRSKQTRTSHSNNTIQNTMRRKNSRTTSVNHSRQSSSHSKRFQRAN